ncbi:MAG: hypothetical protein IPM79_27475 [Polyangiaceae bacterium]|nr:hypothetical protein [Polyangiaceae bacterium]
MARKKRPHVATPDEVRISRDGDFAIIAYHDETIETTQYRVGSDRLTRMTDEDILALWNAGLATAIDDVTRSRRDMRALLSDDGTLHGTVESYPNAPNQPFFRVGQRMYTAMELAHLLGGYVASEVIVTIVPGSGPASEPPRPR